MKQKHTKYTQINTNKSTHSEMGPVWQNPYPENCKNCSSKCAYDDCAQLQYTIQHRTVLIIFPLTSRQA